MLSAELIAQIRNLEIKAKRLATDALSGEFASAFHGRGMEFQEVREYVPGDDVRAIDWNVTARTHVPHIKVYREERELTIILAVDVSPSARGLRSSSEREAAHELAAVIAWLAIRNNDRVGLLLFSDGVERFVPARKGRAHVWRLIKDLYTYEPRTQTGPTKTNIQGALEHLQKVQRRSATCFVISDFWADDFARGLKQCARQHDITCVSIRDPLAEALPQAGLVRWVDSESGQIMLLDTSHPHIAGSYASSQKERKARLSKLFHSAGADHFEVSTDRSVVQPLMSYLRTCEHRKLKRGSK